MYVCCDVVCDVSMVVLIDVVDGVWYVYGWTYI